MGLANLDLNLLVALNALLEERNVTRAGARVGLSQPAMSAALARLRRHFHDDLLVRIGNGYELTAMASGLVEATATACASVSRVFTAQPAFQPAESGREFTVLLSDCALAVLGGGLSRALRKRAPHVHLDLLHLTPAALDDSLHTLRTVDAVVLPHGFLRDHPSLDLYRDRWVVMAWIGNPEIGDELTVDQLGRLPWISPFRRPTAFSDPARQLSALGITPRVDLVVENFLSLPMLIAGTDRVALVPERLVERLRGFSDIRILTCPYVTTPIVEAIWWHPMHQRDAGHAWLRDLFADVGRELDSSQT
jgi:DNA-binding transcriptional LysR family regulator